MDSIRNTTDKEAARMAIIPDRSLFKTVVMEILEIILSNGRDESASEGGAVPFSY